MTVVSQLTALVKVNMAIPALWPYAQPPPILQIVSLVDMMVPGETGSNA